MDVPLSPRLQEFWFNFLPGRFMQLRAIAAGGNIWELDNTVTAILNTLPKAGLTQADQEILIKEVNQLKLQCYCIRAGRVMSLYNSMLEHSNGLELCREANKIIGYLEYIVTVKPLAIIEIKFSADDPVEVSYAASELLDKLNQDCTVYSSKFKSTLDDFMERMEIYAGNMDMDNFFFDLRLRTRKLEAGIELALEYARFLGIDMTEKINEIRIKARKTMGLDIRSYN